MSTITNLTGTTWTFKNNELGYIPFGTVAIDFISNNNTGFHSLSIRTTGYTELSYGGVIAISNGTWTNENYKTITITGGADVENADLITFLEENARQLVLQIGTTLVFTQVVKTTTGLGTYNINFTSNGENFVKIKADYRGYTPIYYYKEDGTEVKAYDNSQWTNQAYRTIEITGGADIGNTQLIAFFGVATIVKLNLNETKTALKIYEDLSPKEYDALEKEPNSFYLVNGVGVYKGDKLITSINLTPLENDIANLKNYVGTLNARYSQLETDKQDKLTAGENITIEDDGTISAEGLIILNLDTEYTSQIPTTFLNKLDKCVLYREGNYYHCARVETQTDYYFEYFKAITNTTYVIYVDGVDGAWWEQDDVGLTEEAVNDLIANYMTENYENGNTGSY